MQTRGPRTIHSNLGTLETTVERAAAVDRIFETCKEKIHAGEIVEVVMPVRRLAATWVSLIDLALSIPLTFLFGIELGSSRSAAAYLVLTDQRLVCWELDDQGRPDWAHGFSCPRPEVKAPEMGREYLGRRQLTFHLGTLHAITVIAKRPWLGDAAEMYEVLTHRAP